MSILKCYPNHGQDIIRCSIDVVSNRLVTCDNSTNGFIFKWNENFTQEVRENQTDESSDDMKGCDWTH